MSGPPTKRPRTESVPRREQEEAPTLASVLLPLVQEGFLRHQELGRLSQTSRRFERQCNEKLWKTLCYHRWLITSSKSPYMIDSLGGYSGWYRRMIALPEQPVEPPPLHPPSLRPDQCEILVDISRGGESIYSEAIRVDSLVKRGFLGKGLIFGFCYRVFGANHSEITPVVLGNASCFLQGACNCENRCRFNLIEDDFDVTMHLQRSDGTISRIYTSTKREPHYRTKGGTSFHFPNDPPEETLKKSDDYCMDLGPGVPNEQHGLPFRWTPMAADIQRRLQTAIFFDILPVVKIFEWHGKEVAAIVGTQIGVAKYRSEGPPWDCFVSNDEANNNGVTLMHILQELQSV